MRLDFATAVVSLLASVPVTAVAVKAFSAWRAVRVARREDAVADASIPLPERDDLTYTQRARRELHQEREESRALQDKFTEAVAGKAAAEARADALAKELQGERADLERERREHDATRARAEAAEKEVARLQAARGPNVPRRPTPRR